MPSRSAPSARSRRTFAPVAISAEANDTSSFDESRTTRSPTSSFIADTRVRSSTEFSSHHDSGTINASSRPDRPARYPFDSGGRSYGGACSPPATRTDTEDPPAPRERPPAGTPPPAPGRGRPRDAPPPPPPSSRTSTSRSATSGGARGLVRGREAGRDLVLEP